MYIKRKYKRFITIIMAFVIFANSMMLSCIKPKKVQGAEVALLGYTIEEIVMSVIATFGTTAVIHQAVTTAQDNDDFMEKLNDIKEGIKDKTSDVSNAVKENYNSMAHVVSNNMEYIKDKYGTLYSQALEGSGWTDSGSWDTGDSVINMPEGWLEGDLGSSVIGVHVKLPDGLAENPEQYAEEFFKNYNELDEESKIKFGGGGNKGNNFKNSKFWKKVKGILAISSIFLGTGAEIGSMYHSQFQQFQQLEAEKPTMSQSEYDSRYASLFNEVDFLSSTEFPEEIKEFEMPDEWMNDGGNIDIDLNKTVANDIPNLTFSDRVLSDKKFATDSEIISKMQKTYPNDSLSWFKNNYFDLYESSSNGYDLKVTQSIKNGFDFWVQPEVGIFCHYYPRHSYFSFLQYGRRGYTWECVGKYFLDRSKAFYEPYNTIIKGTVCSQGTITSQRIDKIYTDCPFYVIVPNDSNLDSYTAYRIYHSSDKVNGIIDGWKILNDSMKLTKEMPKIVDENIDLNFNVNDKLSVVTPQQARDIAVTDKVMDTVQKVKDRVQEMEQQKDDTISRDELQNIIDEEVKRTLDDTVNDVKDPINNDDIDEVINNKVPDNNINDKDPDKDPDKEPDKEPDNDKNKNPHNDIEPDSEENIDFKGINSVDLKGIFPFCIPWDIMAVISFLKAPPEAPVFKIPFKYEKLGIDYTLVVDFNNYVALSRILRTFLALMYLISLVYLSRGLVKG